jgi:hypothetical protein
MEDELWFAYLQQVAQQEKAAAADAAHQEKAVAADAAHQEKALAAGAAHQEKALAAGAALPAEPEPAKPAARSPFSCEELPSE